MTVRRGLALLGIFALFAAAAPAWAQSGASVSGTVRDSVHQRPLRDALVTVAALNGADTQTVKTDSLGNYVVPFLPAGPYVFSVQHPWLDSTELRISPDTVTLTGSARHVDLGVPSPVRIYMESCHEAPSPGRGIVVGYVRSAETGAPVANAAVGFLWNDFTIDEKKKLSVRTFKRGGYVRTDSSGAFRACDIPVGQPITIQAQLDTVRTTGVLDAVIDKTGLLLASLSLGVEPHHGAKGPYAVSGVVKAENGAVISRARVWLEGDTLKTTSDAQGNFRLTGLYPGSIGLQVQAVGFAPTNVTTIAGPQSKPMLVLLPTAAVMLDSVHAYASRVGVREGRQSFNERLKSHAPGALLTSDDIHSRNPHETTDLLRMLPWVSVDGTGLDAHVGLRVKPPGGGNMGVSCPQVYVDGVEWKQDESLNLIAPSVIYGMEAYRFGDPSPAGYANICGLIFFWTK